MPKGFCGAVSSAFADVRTKWVVLGDSTHGEKSLKSLAAAVQAGQLNLRDHKVTTVLIEGPKRGQEETFEEGAYGRAVRILKQHQIQVRGCENKRSLRSGRGIERLYAAPAGTHDPASFTAAMGALLDQRITDANDTWIRQVQDCKPNVIICVGTSHAARMHTTNATDLGLVVRLGFKGLCVGYAVEASNTANGMYVPELGSGSFDGIEAIAPFPGWQNIH
jgi:hypothetical protein